jgi:iron(III) transport system substrate-binding protein
LTVPEKYWSEWVKGGREKDLRGGVPKGCGPNERKKTKETRMNVKKGIRSFATASLAMILVSSVVYAKTRITIFSSIHADVLAAIAGEFNKRSPDVEIKYFRLVTAKIIAKVNAEVKAGEIKADLVWTAEPAYFEELKQRGLITKYLSPTAKDIPKLFIDPDGY